MQVSVELAQEILQVLENKNPRDAISALKIALILLPVKPPSTPEDATPQVRGESVLEVQ
jgi:hypothetical protein